LTRKENDNTYQLIIEQEKEDVMLVRDNSSYVAAMLGSRNKLNLPTVPDAHGLAALSIDLNMSGLANSLNPI
jgi:hypothetical protein